MFACPEVNMWQLTCNLCGYDRLQFVAVRPDLHDYDSTIFRLRDQQGLVKPLKLLNSTRYSCYANLTKVLPFNIEAVLKCSTSTASWIGLYDTVVITCMVVHSA